MSRVAAVIERIRRLATASDIEICGALFADGNGICEAVPLSNRSPQPATAFYIPAAEVARLERDAEQRGRILAGFYHSHQHGSAMPSAFDLELAFPGYIYWIVGRDQVRAWRLREDRSRFTEVKIQ